MAGDSVIVNRGQDGEINVLLNRCSHRGTELCMSETGNTRQFRCPYHGWLYAPDGRLKALPAANEWLGDHSSKSEYGLRKARVETRGGLIFGTWDEDMVDFESYLGDFTFYFDMLFCSVNKDLVSVGAPQRWTVPFNWKLGAENFTGDTYHLQTAHASLTEIGMVPPLEGMYVAFGADPKGGHGYQSVLPVEGVDPPELSVTLPWIPAEVLPELEEHMNPEQMSILKDGAIPLVGNFFPNFSWLASPFFFFLRTWQPISPNEIEIRTWTMTHPDASEADRKARLQGVNLTFGATGMFETDDMTIFARIQRQHENLIGSREPVSYAATLGEPDSDWPGPGLVWKGMAADDHLWNFHLRWLHLMTGGEL
jgi:phenylpropionate dioxygenase-like ring-hydroxylating dioxygenase large terminal subunit